MNANFEQRQYLRYQIFDYVAVFLADNHAPIPAMLVDMGLGGAQLRSKQSLPEGAAVVLKVAGEEGSVIELKGQVRHCSKVEESALYGTGIRFAPDTHGERLAVAEFVHGIFQRQRERLLN